MTIWNGITEQGAVVPIQVDAQGRVVVSGGGGVPAEVFGTAKVWGRIASNASTVFGSGFSGSSQGTGQYQVTFSTPLPNSEYIVLVTPSQASTIYAQSYQHSAQSFRVDIRTETGSLYNAVFDFAVFNFLPSEVTPLILPTSTVEQVKALRSEVDKLKRDKTP